MQAEWSVFARDIEASVLPAVREVGAALVAYSPLGRGFLSGKFAGFDDLPDGDFRQPAPLRRRERPRQRGTPRPAADIAAAHGATPAQVALAWVHSRTKADRLPVVPIPRHHNPDRSRGERGGGRPRPHRRRDRRPGADRATVSPGTGMPE
ncbi:aldo/keto reductase [Yinghuangia aomiensis]